MPANAVYEDVANRMRDGFRLFRKRRATSRNAASFPLTRRRAARAASAILRLWLHSTHTSARRRGAGSGAAMPADATVRQAVAEALRDGLRHLLARAQPSEGDARQLLVEPALTALGYPPAYRRHEVEKNRNKPDIICYASELLEESGYGALIVEAKPRDTDFDKAQGGARPESPDRQIQRYMRQHPASGPHSIGALSDGLRWRIYERTGSPSSSDIRFLREYDFTAIATADAPLTFLEGAGAEGSDAEGADAAAGKEGSDEGTDVERADAAFREFVDYLCRECVVERMRDVPRARRARLDRAERLLAAFAEGAPRPGAVLPHLLGGRMAEFSSNLTARVPLEGIVLDAHDRDWSDYAYALGTPLPPPAAGQAPLPMLGERQVAVAAARFTPDPRGLSRGDAALCARAFARASNGGTSALLAYQETEDGAAEARLAACAGGRVAMTAPFDPGMPSPSAKAAIEEVLAALAAPETDADRLLAPLDVAPLRQRFYAEVSAWTKRLAAGREQAHREAVLRHLIRVMFAWILKEDGLVPAELFERGFADAAMPDAERYHAETLRFLFHQRLNIPEEKRDPHPNAALDAVMANAPFLNGSIFMEQDGDDGLDLPPDAYWNPDEDAPGLFTIFSRYHWTTDEHRPGESDQTLDPELLSNLFERLILPIESDETLDRQPRGTYYTPADVTLEMVKDALAAASRPQAPRGSTYAELLDLFGDRGAPVPASWIAPDRRRLAARIRAIRIFDPAAGSGAFLFGCLTALQTALEKLEPTAPEPTPEVIKRQLHGQDIHPLAAQITRLRLFIALKAADRKANRDAPLPNLEARIVCADTLGTVADPDWRPSRSGRLADPGLMGALRTVADARASWLDAHTEEEKQVVLQAHGEAGERLSGLLRENGPLISQELIEFAERTPLFHANPLPSKTDPRLLFHEEPWSGFDVVIGNPPYEALRESMSADEIFELAGRKLYRTTNAGNLYTLFCEAALALAKPEGGVVTMVVPLSIAFGQQERTLREVFEKRCNLINLRHYDVRPDAVFNASPTVKTPENTQRATILTASVGKSKRAALYTTGLRRWPAEEREQCLADRSVTMAFRPSLRVDENIETQWARTPTPEVRQMMQAMIRQKRAVRDYCVEEGPSLAFQLTARYFISTIPYEAASPRSERRFEVADDNAMRLVMAALNGHVGYGWWTAFSDGFHVNEREIETVAVPDAWAADPAEAAALGQRLIDAIPQCEVSMLMRGKVWRNVDFHTHAPDLIEEIDRLYIEALGMPVEPLLTHLRILRSNRSWDFGARG